jgi:hypothetical protein
MRWQCFFSGREITGPLADLTDAFRKQLSRLEILDPLFTEFFAATDNLWKIPCLFLSKTSNARIFTRDLSAASVFEHRSANFLPVIL